MQVRITKYNPIYRDESGAYLKEEWTCPTEIGKPFNGRLFTVEEYLEVEDAYVSCLLSLVKHLGLRELEVDIFIAWVSSNEQIDHISEKEISEYSKFWVEHLGKGLWDSSLNYLGEKPIGKGSQISVDELEPYFRLNLRDVIGLRFKGEGNTVVTFGHDFYVYLSSDLVPSFDPIKVPEGIFLEHCEDPYRENSSEDAEIEPDE